MYDGLLKVPSPKEVKLVAYADDVAVIIVAKHLDEINLAFDKAFERIKQWMKTVNLQLVKHKTDAVLITRRKKAETIKLQVGEQEITSQPYIRYLGVMIDARLNFKQQVEHVSTKASAVRASLARLMPNVGGPKRSKILLLSSVVTSVLTYGISIWSHMLGIQETWRKAGPVYRLSALRVASAFRTISEEAVCIISGVLPLRVLAKEKTLYQRNRSSTLSTEELREENGRIVYADGSCHTASHCSYSGMLERRRDELETILNQRILPETLVEAMLSTKAAWNATSTFATKVLTDLRSIERRRAKDSN
ncbi:Retrovirus-related Pol polyprotein from type-1 retrotransposable element R1 [Eumeta japonica]|uniref:Retrovirus-related Pol polyprotein from type-1 retrotransposable element R1 n=1 Tax=Eumeta variegata TaxID=151549 RepID=A0A4C1Y3S4_EUMVA|nr:Retrovirus-related Pol polyprotein from type-1 retrotransposable element R1 [Eumeta japonica]